MRLFIGLLVPCLLQAQEEITVELPGGETMEMVWIEPGTFTMGTTQQQVDELLQDGIPDEGPCPCGGPPTPKFTEWELPAHEVTLTRGFYLGKFEVTQQIWESVMGTTPWEGAPASFQDPDFPTHRIEWRDARAFMARLNEAVGDSLYRLPTEAEWEYACRAGTTTLWSFGDDPSLNPRNDLSGPPFGLKKYEEYGFTGGILTAVGSLKPNPWGLYDMYGNAEELVLESTLYPYTEEAQVDPIGVIPANPDGGLTRGGEAEVNGHNVEAWRSGRSGSRSRSSDHGRRSFRVLRMAQTETSVTPQSWGMVKGATDGD